MDKVLFKEGPATETLVSLIPEDGLDRESFKANMRAYLHIYNQCLEAQAILSASPAPPYSEIERMRRMAEDQKRRGLLSSDEADEWPLEIARKMSVGKNHVLWNVKHMLSKVRKPVRIPLDFLVFALVSDVKEATELPHYEEVSDFLTEQEVMKPGRAVESRGDRIKHRYARAALPEITAVLGYYSNVLATENKTLLPSYLPAPAGFLGDLAYGLGVRTDPIQRLQDIVKKITARCEHRGDDWASAPCPKCPMRTMARITVAESAMLISRFKTYCPLIQGT